MKRIFFITLLLLSTAYLPAQHNNAEFRACWVVDGHWLSSGNTAEQNKALIRQVLDRHVEANMTSVLWQVRRYGSVYYPSAIEPWGTQVNFQNPGFDPLAYAIEQAHARGLEFHAWFNTFESRFRYAGTPSQLHPEWICRDQDGIQMPDEIAWLSPGLPAVREYLKSVAMEIVTNYDVDGVHLDFVRWSEHVNSDDAVRLAMENLENQNLPDGWISEAQDELMKNNSSGRYLYDVDHPYSAGVPSGYGSWEEWWRASVTALVSELHTAIQGVKPWVRLSPAALGRYNWGGWQGYGSVYQDAALWLNQGYIDQIAGMHYHWSSAGDIYDVLEGGCPSCWSQFIQPAILAGRHYTVGLFSDNFASSNLFGRHQSIIDTIRSVTWADGVQFFSYGSWRDENYWQTAKELFFQTKTKIRATGLISTAVPDAPTLSLNKLDSLNYEITVTPAPSVTENHWFAIYRSEDANLDVNTDAIIQIRFGDAPMSYTDSFDGLQNFNGTYWYFATNLNRYWNESAVSNAAQSDPIPSFAPEVTGTVPAEGDTLPVQNSLTVTFTKSMDVNSFQNAITFNPAAAISELTWSDHDRVLTINPDGDLQFNTAYSMTMAGSVTDVNGRPLAGGPFVLNFQTLEEDMFAPQLVSSYPSTQVMEEDFLIDEVMTFVFDEYLDPASVTDSTIALTRGGTPVDADYLVSDLDNFSLLSVQASDPLVPDQQYHLSIAPGITDTLGNAMSGGISLDFKTSPVHYSDQVMIENYTFPGDWFQPNGSGSTVGIVVSNTTFGFTASNTPPAHRPKKSAFLNYEWEPGAGTWLIREYLSGGAPRNVLFDTSYVLQCYVFGDGSNTLFRFAIDDNVPNTGAGNHEVSTWTALDWYGWRLVEWDLGDPNSVGNWIGDGIVEGTLRFDSFQLAYDPGFSAVTGRIYFDNIRLVKKTTDPVAVTVLDNAVPESFRLYQNYPNPFNPATTIAFDLPESGKVKLTVFDVLGREVKTLLDGRRNAGSYEVSFDASDLASGVYIYRLSTQQQALARRMLLVK